MSQTILFVDEERFVHKALKRSFRSMREEWDMRFANNPQEALQDLNAKPADVVVTETVFTDHNGLDFIKTVKEQHPQVVRIILSGYSDRDVILKSVDLAHQYLAKPCEDETLKATISRAFLMKALLAQGPLKKVVSQIDSLPSLPALYVELMEELKSEEASIQKVGDIIAKDIAFSVKILKLVNSAFFGLPQHISNPAKAVSMLGIDIIQALVLTSGTFDKFKHVKIPGFSLEDLWQHGMTVATFAKIIALKTGMDHKTAETAFIAGLLHDIGTLLLASHLPKEFAQILKMRTEASVSISEAELAMLGTTHAGVGAYLLGLWGLPDAIIDSAAFHHAPSERPFNNLSPLIITHVANALANTGPQLDEPNSVVAGLDYELLKNANLLDDIKEWKHACVAHLAGMAS